MTPTSRVLSSHGGGREAGASGALPRVIGHRGAAAAAPENTRASFRRARAEGAQCVELDVQLSRDGVAVVFHDDALDRTSNGRGRLVDTDWCDLARLDVGGWFAPTFTGQTILRLEEALIEIATLGMGVNIEIKADDARAEQTATTALAVAAETWPADRPPPWISSFSTVAVAVAQRQRPDWPRGWLVEQWPESWPQVTQALACRSLNCDWKDLTQHRVETLRAAGLDVLAYTVNRVATARRLWRWGVTSIFSDSPGRMLKSADAHL